MNSITPVNKPIIIGQISGVFGVHGWVKVFSHTEPRENILTYSPWQVKLKDGWSPMVLIKGRKQGKTIVAQIKGIDNRDKAHALIGNDISIDEEQLKQLEDDDFYWRELQGLTVVNHNNVTFGVVSEMMATGANDVMVVKGTREYLVPYIEGQVVQSVDLEAGVITVDWDPDF